MSGRQEWADEEERDKQSRAVEEEKGRGGKAGSGDGGRGSAGSGRSAAGGGVIGEGKELGFDYGRVHVAWKTRGGELQEERAWAGVGGQMDATEFLAGGRGRGRGRLEQRRGVYKEGDRS